MAKQADVIAKADTPEVRCYTSSLVCCLVQLTELPWQLAWSPKCTTYSLTVFAGDDGRDHARDYEQPPTGAFSKVPHATPILLTHSHTTAGPVLGRKCGRHAGMGHNLDQVAAAGTCVGRLIACECSLTAARLTTYSQAPR